MTEKETDEWHWQSLTQYYNEAAGFPHLDWCGACQAWHESEKHIVAPDIREKILDFKALWFGIEKRSDS